MKLFNEEILSRDVYVINSSTHLWQNDEFNSMTIQRAKYFLMTLKGQVILL